ncbi:M10 family metallopeptidase C-terminal domain-containing protein [Desmonostoc muscorum LEGE 12446]|uniref:M10 family metallopeptidase C-terminal domain-containing protein n=1 Tax=Desmonostoc muscorum LEGE 12446 TaxID=1828758 RepID=A0A8J6ZRP6_DESMC|nr:M10 family metallopeptidase C-terminal domain-containing protein [Desmonostoc muscorum]MCF2147694.1 M10 family metallopeptidase C-terminal domain-containing protein [Desmonostoc muscorum LEGE 12446]
MTTPYYVDALLFPGQPHWAKSSDGITRIKYSFRPSSDEKFNFDQREAVRRIVKLYENIAKIDFIEVPDDQNPQIRFGIADRGENEGADASGTPGSYVDIWLNNNPKAMVDGFSKPTEGNYAFMTLMHEIGHALGLKHTGDYNANGGGTPGPYLYGQEDSLQYTIMSYNGATLSDGTIAGTNYQGSGIFALTPQLYDVAAIQYLYGPNNNFNTGDTLYLFSSSKAFLGTIWDNGGVDTINASTLSLAAKIDLNTGSDHFSSIGPFSDSFLFNRAFDNVAIVDGVVIENAYGGSGNDTIIGNGAENYLSANNGNDSLKGGDNNDTLEGGSGDDFLNGGEGNDLLIEGNGNNLIIGGNGFDTLKESGNADFTAFYDHIEKKTFSGVTKDSYSLFDIEHLIIEGGVSENTLNGGSFGWGSVELYGGENDDTLTGGLLGGDILNGGDGNDTLIEGGDTSYFLDDAHLIKGNFTDSLFSIEKAKLTGGGKDNSIDASHFSGSVYLLGNAGNDFLYGGKSDDDLDGGNGNDQIFGGAGNDDLFGGLGDDLLNGGTNTDTVSESGDVSFFLLNGITLIGNGTDSLVSIEKLKLTGGNSGHTLNVSSFTGTASLFGNAGNDILYGGLGADFLSGGADYDIIRQEATSFDINFILKNNQLITKGVGKFGLLYTVTDTLFSIEGAQLIGNSSNNSIDASAFTQGGVLLNGKQGNDTLLGGQKDDTLIGGTGNDSINGGAGIDTILEGGFDFTLKDGSLLGNGTDILNSIEKANLTGNGGNNFLNAIEFTGSVTLDGGFGIDTLYGAAGDDILIGGRSAEDDAILGNGGNDLVYGGDFQSTTFTGNDALNGGAGNDTLFGGDGNDFLIGDTNDDQLFGGFDNDTLFGNDGNDTLMGEDGLDNLYGGDGIDSLSGGNGIDYIEGNIGDDLLFGDDGDDILHGGDNNDKLNGGNGNDQLFGDTGNDTLMGVQVSVGSNFGKDEIDILIGGQGQDSFVFGSSGNLFFYNDGNLLSQGTTDYARIIDFGLDDRIVLAGSKELYTLSAVPTSIGNSGGRASDTGIYLNMPGTSELIGVIQDVSLSTSDLQSTSFFSFVG